MLDCIYLNHWIPGRWLIEDQKIGLGHECQKIIDGLAKLNTLNNPEIKEIFNKK